jgi:thymidine phosphorylase
MTLPSNLSSRRTVVQGAAVVCRRVFANHPRPIESLCRVRGKVYGRCLDEKALRAIVSDVVRRYSDIQLADEVVSLTTRVADPQV